MIKIISQGEKQTRKIGELLGKELFKIQPLKKGVVIGLEGELGGGKTTFIQGLAKGLNIKERILSPTFVIFKKFNIPAKYTKYLYHIDCYRLYRSRELVDLGFGEIIQDPQNIVVIEWADKLKNILPKDKIMIEFRWISKDKREISIL